MKTIRIYRNAQPIKRMVADDADAQRACEKMGDGVSWLRCLATASGP